MVWQDFKQQVFHFVVLEHVRNTDLHWDFMLQMPDRQLLPTWQIRHNPTQWMNALQPIPALQRPDHRLVYLDYEGEISGGRGHVTRFDAGEMELLRHDDRQIEVVLHGQILNGPFIIRQVPAVMECQDNWWQLWRSVR